ncbi:dihydrodipicolinate synthase family protein [Microvirga pudoricolor]|uniref:dihydrodipicolinate synthase family protein n=1 Tax=Microvirga pudoricolor TaxID=2778729 RepID=UPI001950EA75|nr:dihydrodipicolinate synthase family protein [Microvirga pudoricolor]MBM6595099.1 dihydrodipicolinate synthase family protein [Microvirga pudoricolor]
MSTDNKLRGVLVPLTTPFDSTGELDLQAFRSEVDWALSHGVHGVVVGGSTGEGYTLEADELAILTSAAVDCVSGQIPVIASIIVDSARSALGRIEALKHVRIEALQIAPPHYIFRPSIEGLLEFYRTLSAAADVPVIIYNVLPWDILSPATCATILKTIPEVCGVKQSDKSFEAYSNLVAEIGPDKVYAAIDNALMSCYQLGAAGSIAAVASAAPGPNVELWNAIQAGNTVRAVEIHAGLVRLWNTLKGDDLPARIKAAQGLQGLSDSFPRAPMLRVKDRDREAIRDALEQLPVRSDFRPQADPSRQRAV